MFRHFKVKKKNILPVDVLFVNVGSVNNLMRDGLICHIVCAADANRSVPGHLSTKTPERQQQQTEDKTAAVRQFEVCFSS